MRSVKLRRRGYRITAPFSVAPLTIGGDRSLRSHCIRFRDRGSLLCICPICHRRPSRSNRTSGYHRHTRCNTLLLAVEPSSRRLRNLDFDARLGRVLFHARSVPAPNPLVVHDHASLLQRVRERLVIVNGVASVRVTVEDGAHIHGPVDSLATGPVNTHLRHGDRFPTAIRFRWHHTHTASAAGTNNRAMILLGPRCADDNHHSRPPLTTRRPGLTYRMTRFVDRRRRRNTTANATGTLTRTPTMARPARSKERIYAASRSCFVAVSIAVARNSDQWAIRQPDPRASASLMNCSTLIPPVSISKSYRAISNFVMAKRYPYSIFFTCSPSVSAI